MTTSGTRGLYAGQPVCLDTAGISLPINEDVGDPEQIILISQHLFGITCTVHKLSFGAHNILYLMTLDGPIGSGGATTAVFRLANRFKFQSCINMESELDTMLYVQQKTTIPVPKIYGYSLTGRLMGSSFMIMEHIANGSSAVFAFERLTPEERVRTLKDYANVVYQLSQQRFNAIGSLYRDIEGKFKVGPLSLARPDANLRVNLSTYRSARRPYHSVQHWLETVEKDALLFLQKYPERLRDGESDLQWEEDTTDAQDVMQKTIKSIPLVFEEGGLSRVLCLWHVDMSAWNFMIYTTGPQAGHIISVIDWENAGVFPIWRVISPPSMCLRIGAGRLRDDTERLQYENIYRAELRRLDKDGLLSSALEERWNFPRKLAQTISRPWHYIDERIERMEEFAKLEETYQHEWDGLAQASHSRHNSF